MLALNFFAEFHYARNSYNQLGKQIKSSYILDSASKLTATSFAFNQKFVQMYSDYLEINIKITA